MSPSKALQAFVEHVELMEVGVFELEAKRGPQSADGTREIVGPGRLEDGEIGNLQFELHIIQSDDEEYFLVRLRGSSEGDLGYLAVGVQAEYRIEEFTEHEVNATLLQEFAERVALMTIAPYMRHQVSQLAREVLSTEYTLGILRNGELEFTSSGAGETDKTVNSL